MSKNNQIYYAIDYLRLSVDDGDKLESDSISNQRILIQGFRERHPDEFVHVEELVDDGYTGTNFERPGFKRMMELLESDEANCIILKDLSRFGRDFSGVLRYIERILPRMGVRVILINDDYDSLSESVDLLAIRLKSFINDIYPADTSKSVRANLHAKMRDGQCIAAFAPYGYRKHPHDKNKLILDEFAAGVVNDIFQLSLKGYSLNATAEILNSQKILPPLAYKHSNGEKQQTGFVTKAESTWDATMIRRILINEVYLGNLVQGKRTTPNYKVKKIIRKPEDEWVRKENTHDAIIDIHTFEVAASLLERETRRTLEGMPPLLSGLVECAECHQNMIRKSPNRKNYYYICTSSLYEKSCSAHSFSEKKLTELVSQSILHYISVMVELQKVLETASMSSVTERELLKVDKRMAALEDECRKIIQVKENLYKNFCEGLINETEFYTYKEKYNRKFSDLEEVIKQQKFEMENIKETIEKQREWMKYFLVHKDKTQIDRMMVSMLVKRVRIESKKRVYIDFWFADEFESALALLESMNQIQPDVSRSSFLQKGGAHSA